jgi:hypothetical protein
MARTVGSADPIPTREFLWVERRLWAGCKHWEGGAEILWVRNFEQPFCGRILGDVLLVC